MLCNITILFEYAKHIIDLSRLKKTKLAGGAKLTIIRMLEEIKYSAPLKPIIKPCSFRKTC